MRRTSLFYYFYFCLTKIIIINFFCGSCGNAITETKKKKQIYCKLEEQAFHIKRILFLNCFGVIPFTTLSAKDKSSATNTRKSRVRKSLKNLYGKNKRTQLHSSILPLQADTFPWNTATFFFLSLIGCIFMALYDLLLLPTTLSYAQKKTF